MLIIWRSKVELHTTRFLPQSNILPNDLQVLLMGSWSTFFTPVILIPFASTIRIQETSPRDHQISCAGPRA